MILRRYMTQQVAANTAIVLLFLMALMLGGRLIRYFGIAAEGRLDVVCYLLLLAITFQPFLS